ncbi:MAG: type II toxin-antitoxin system RatA family toxin, partial [Alphaproteobacteria bacterium]|nr:type II toxin-antitoxin system RatA family toxin [Alphaproteobacteria bacterium]
MHRHDEKRVLPYTAAQLYELVSDVERYPEFLPWCIAARVTARDNIATYADLVIGFRMIRERFGSRIVGVSPHSIDVSPVSGPFRRLANSWRFSDLEDGG